MPFTPSKQHTAIFGWVDANAFDPKRKEIAALIISAVAGAGKTTTLREICNRIPVRESFGGVVPDILYLAFNRSAVDDVKARGLAQHVEAKTLNGMGYAAIRKHNRRADTRGTKTTDLLAERLSEQDFKTYSVTVNKLVGLAKSQGLAPAGVDCPGAILADTVDNWNALIDRFDVDAPFDNDSLMPRAIEIARKVLVASLLNTDVVDFDDQLWIPLMLGLPMARRFRYVFVDEAQDLNPVQRRLLRGAVEKGGTLIAVGDPHQAIYGFRGADSASIDMIVKEYAAKVLPLSVTWRCPRSVVALAQTIVPGIEAAPTAAEGEILHKTASEITDWSPADLVVCRTNAPLVSLAYALLRKKIPVRIAGRDFAQGLEKLINKLRPVDLVDLSAKLVDHLKRERAKLTAGGKEAKVQALEDKVETLQVLADEADTLPELEKLIATLFSDNDKARATTLSSIHRAKGAEAHRVFVLKPELMPLKAAKLPWEMEQERNLQYVAYTRAGATLVFLSDDGKGSKKKTKPTTTAKAPELPLPVEKKLRELGSDLSVAVKHHGAAAVVDAYDRSFLNVDALNGDAFHR